MIQAQLYGKAASELTWSEDVLTSNIFGLLKYLSTPEVLLTILQGAYNLDYEPLVFETHIERISYTFWPRLQNSEPDLVLILHAKSGVHIIGVEAKYLSGKSSEEDLLASIQDRDNKQRDQLAREIEDLHDSANYPMIGVEESSILSIRLIYLTMESYIPHDELQASLESLKAHSACQFPSKHLYWLSWKTFYDNLKCTNPSATDSMILTDLRSYLNKKSIRTFSGFSMKPVGILNWCYTKNRKRPLQIVPSLTWKYKEANHGTN
ncbi:hypothetical protein DUZ99_18680 [Xylanibacillus composti]|uniref:NERD domain-containing protein n=1 Tax=Xylanibacillus composti TaxID=1572762 RepID=A0A8J4M276_9BACL|nr:hypothetical protein [Xylanibacillus composti]MDT9726995.1 hypothetical protein [Xylanibacillus composti]GIQ69555.1 hypothetical protein XYCOK13_23790 [Xylanibacillus composti]